MYAVFDYCHLPKSGERLGYLLRHQSMRLPCAETSGNETIYKHICMHSPRPKMPVQTSCLLLSVLPYSPLSAIFFTSNDRDVGPNTLSLSLSRAQGPPVGCGQVHAHFLDQVSHWWAVEGGPTSGGQGFGCHVGAGGVGVCGFIPGRQAAPPTATQLCFVARLGSWCSVHGARCCLRLQVPILVALCRGRRYFVADPTRADAPTRDFIPQHRAFRSSL